MPTEFASNNPAAGVFGTRVFAQVFVHMFYQEGATKCVMEIVAAGASTVASYNGDLPLHLASKLGQPQVPSVTISLRNSDGSAQLARASAARAHSHPDRYDAHAP
jgi:hypothetical protein